MGCGASVSPCTQEQKDELCQAGCKEMMLLCVTDAMAKKDQIVIKPPDTVNKFRGNAQKLRDAAAFAVDGITELCGSDKAQNMVGEQSGGGLLGKAMGFMAEAADAVVGMVGATAGAFVEKSMNGLASGIDKAVDAVEEPFTQVGKDIVASKTTQLAEVYANYINKYKFNTPLKLVRGEPEDYEKCPTDSISKDLLNACKKELEQPLLDVVQEEIKKHKVTKAWDGCIEKTNGAIDKVGEYEKLKGFCPEKIELDIDKYVVAETISQLGELMAAAEAAIRADSANKSRIPVTFAAIFSGQPLTKAVYKNKAK